MDGSLFWGEARCLCAESYGFCCQFWGKVMGSLRMMLGMGVFPWDLNSQGFVPLRDDLISVDSLVINGLVPR